MRLGAHIWSTDVSFGPMRHARSDYDAIQPWPTKRPHLVKVDGETRNNDEDKIEDWEAPSSIEPIIPHEEPVFLLRAQDVCSIPAVETWCVEAEREGADPEFVAAARRHIDAMREWQATHPRKTPDAPVEVLRP